MVLQRPVFFEQVSAFFESHPEIDLLTVAVHDWFTDELISGLHTYRSHVRWPDHAEDVFVDPSPVADDRWVLDFDTLAPSAWHCPDPSPYQAFHFGMHKAVKVLAARRGRSGRLRAPQGYGHARNVELIWRQFLRTGDPRLGLACVAGIQYAFSEPRAPIVVPWWLSLGSCVLVSVICLIAAVLPYLRIRKIDPMMVLQS